uniref:ORF1 n=1 Tax=Drosophila buzzatii TaxID=7264 RepID=A0A0H3U7E2_DROBU|nr:ORF1 [Drosophila buzzatii]
MLKNKRKKPISPYKNNKRASREVISHSASTNMAKSSNAFALLDMDMDVTSEGEDVENAIDNHVIADHSNAADAIDTGNNHLNQEPDNNKKPQKPPQIVVSITDLNDLFEIISEVTSVDNVSVKVNQGVTARIFAKDSVTYRAIVSHFDTIGIEFHTYQMKEEKPYRIVVKGLHHSTLNHEIIANFKKYGFDALQVHNPRSRSNREEKLNIFFVNIKPCKKINDIYSIKTLCRQMVRVERMRKASEIVICTRCQEYGHSAKYCRRHPNCARCGEDHPTILCTRSQDEPPTCIHCGGNHMASYKGCQWYQDFYRRSTGPSTIKKNQARPQQLQGKQQHQQMRQQPQQLPNTSGVGRSYAAIARNGYVSAQSRIHNIQAQAQLATPIGNIPQQQQQIDVQSLLEQQQHQFLKWQKELQVQQQQQFLSWLQAQQREQQQQNKRNSDRLERLEKMVHEMASMLKQWTGGPMTRQLPNNASASQ